MKRVIAWFVHNPVAANLLMMILIVGGLISLSKLRQEEMPPIDLGIVSVTVPYLGAAPEEVETGVCLRIEEALEGGAQNIVLVGEVVGIGTNDKASIIVGLVRDLGGRTELAGDAGVIQIKTEKILNNVLVYSRQTVEDLMTPIEIVETVEYANKDDYKIPMNHSKCPTVESLVPGETATYMRCDVGYDVYHTERVPGSTPALDITNHLRTADMVFVTDEGDNTIGILCREDVLDALLAQPTKG